MAIEDVFRYPVVDEEEGLPETDVDKDTYVPELKLKLELELELEEENEPRRWPYK